MESAEYLSFKIHEAALLEHIKNPTPLSKHLHSAGLLTSETKKNIRNLILRQQKVCELLDATETEIRLDPSNYHKFVEALEKDSSMQHLCGKLRSTCGECDNVCLSTSTDQCMVL